MARRARSSSWLAPLVLLALFALVGGLAWLSRNVRDRHPGYALDLRVAAGEPAPLAAGFAAVPITPEVPDAWTDRDGDARRGPGDSWEDRNGNGRFDAVWLAGFHPGRPATGVHDELWARALVLDDGRTRLALVVLDAIGFMHDHVVHVRQRVPAEARVDYVIVASTHSHEAPDLMGLWGPGPGRSGVDPAYLEVVIAGAARAVAEAAAALRPATLRLARVADTARALVEDSRRPIVLDPDLRILLARDAASGATLGCLVAWGNHPETTWRDNLRVSSDFPHFLREALEGELGGVAVYASGAIGGLMTTRPGFAVRDPGTGESFERPSFEKARAQGRALAQLALEALAREPAAPGGPGEAQRPVGGEAEGPVDVARAAIGLRARTLELPLDNRMFLLAASLGIVPRGFSRWATLRSEVAAFTVGPASFVTVPGEIYPEIVNGGIESPPGADHPGEPVEVPPLRERMPGRFRFVLGLANDALGYVIPRTEWDDAPPWLYGDEDETYGEVVSLGPDTAPILHRALLGLLDELASDGTR